MVLGGPVARLREDTGMAGRALPAARDGGKPMFAVAMIASS